MNESNARQISKALRHKILSTLGNDVITSREVNVLINEVGTIVAELQELYFGEIRKQERKTNAKIDELVEAIDTVLAEKKDTIVNVTMNNPQPNVDTQQIALEVLKKLGLR